MDEYTHPIYILTLDMRFATSTNDGRSHPPVLACPEMLIYALQTVPLGFFIRC